MFKAILADQAKFGTTGQLAELFQNHKKGKGLDCVDSLRTIGFDWSLYIYIHITYDYCIICMLNF